MPNLVAICSDECMSSCERQYEVEVDANYLMVPYCALKHLLQLFSGFSLEWAKLIMVFSFSKERTNPTGAVKHLHSQMAQTQHIKATQASPRSFLVCHGASQVIKLKVNCPFSQIVCYSSKFSHDLSPISSPIWLQHFCKP